jgi:hypothetical protein
MSILSTDLVAFGSASLPLDDVSTTGAGIDASGAASAPGKRPVFTQLAANTVLRLLSSAADTRTANITGRNAAGAVITEAVVLTGTTPANAVNTYERIQSIYMATTHATNTVTITDSGNTVTFGTIPPNEVGFYSMFLNSASAAGAVVRYEKFFWKNTNATLTLTSAQVTLTADPSSKITMGLATAVNDTVSVANRLTAPASVTFVGLSTAQNVPGNALAAGDKIGTWIKQSLASNDAALKSSLTTQLSGTST